MPAKRQIAKIDLSGLVARYGSEDKCRAYLEGLRWPGGVRCLRCDSDKISRILKRGQFDCDSCRYQFSVKVGTIFHDSHLDLSKWFLATFMLCEAKKGMSANQLGRTLGVSYKTAWYLCHRIRAAMKDASAPLLSGIVEADETWIGGRHKGLNGGNWREHKTMILGALERDGEVRLKVDKRATKRNIHAFLDSAVNPDADALYTDEHSAYKDWVDEDTRHEHVVHHKEEWVRGDVHTNGIESVWSLLKRSVVGSYHQLSEKHMQSYVDEMAWRFNNRDNRFLFRDTLLKLLSAGSLRYEELITNRQVHSR